MIEVGRNGWQKSRVFSPLKDMKAEKMKKRKKKKQMKNEKKERAVEINITKKDRNEREND